MAWQSVHWKKWLQQQRRGLDATNPWCIIMKNFSPSHLIIMIIIYPCLDSNMECFQLSTTTISTIHRDLLYYQTYIYIYMWGCSFLMKNGAAHIHYLSWPLMLLGKHAISKSQREPTMVLWPHERTTCKLA